jgi:hypothetical protein
MSDAITAKLVRGFGQSVTAWAAGLPALVAGLATRWDLTVGEPFADGASSVVFRVTTADGAGLAEPDGVGYRLDAPATAYGLDPDRLLAWCRTIIPGDVVPLLRAGRLSADELSASLRQ